jgi:thioredoxin reductase
MFASACRLLPSLITSIAVTACALPVSAAVVDVDVCIYGGTSGGVAAAVQVARMGKSVVVVEPGRHLGGMTSGGLSAVDIGEPRSVGGIAREYFTKLAAKYGRTLAWGEAFKSTGGPATGGAFAIEPHSAEALFDDMVREAKIPVHRDARLVKVLKQGPRIVELTMEDGNVFRARMFIDATYEGDLMAAAGVEYTLMREGNAKYGEQHNGICYDEKFAPRLGHLTPGSNGRVPGGQGVWDRDLPLDPYVVPGDASSGVLPLIDDGALGEIGDPAPGVQAYCYRLCLSTKDDRIAITPPKDYDPKRYEIVARFIAACQAMGDDIDLRWFSKYDALPNDKFDFNTATFGANLPKASWAWPDATYARRAEIAREHENYHRGLLHFLATDPRVPQKVRDEMARFGLPRDEFADNGGWPHQIYIREARRMVSDFVMTEQHTFGREVAAKSVGLGSYGTDTHEVRRIVRNGVVQREGKTATGRGGFGPYRIGYEAIIPRSQECENLLVTFALSASHTAFSSIRMEPVFMITSQSAATAACLAIDDRTTVQRVDYEKLQTKLKGDGQILVWNEPSELAEVKGKKRPPVQIVKSAKPEEIDGKQYDLIVVGGTPSGIACAVRASRQGLSVLLVNHTGHLGGMMTNGLMQWDALYGGHRAPLFTEMLRNVERHYRETYGEDSNDYRTVCFTAEHYPLGWAEPHVAEREFNRLIAGASSITVLLKYDPIAVERDGALLRSVKLAEYEGKSTLTVSATTFADATYEGDLFAVAKVPYRVGREAREEFNEPHAGKVFTNTGPGRAPLDAVEGRLNIRPYGQKQLSIDPSSPFSADGAVQAFNFRFCVTKDPDNRIMVKKPATYDREDYVNYGRKSIATNAGPNLKSHMNSPILPGENHAYPDADWPTREKIIARHRDFGLGLIWFLQNDESIKESKKNEYRQWGLPKDEYADNDHIPYEMYVRETRRIVGRHVYNENDNSVAPGISRTPIHADSVGITDWYMDSHACTTESRPGYHYDGKLILTEESRPGQIPYRALLPQGVDNLLVPVCMSATHVAWDAVRLEPVWMQLGESAGFAAALAKRHKVAPAALDPELLTRELVEWRMLVSFLNDVDASESTPWVRAAQYFGTKGFFSSYDARPDALLGRDAALIWFVGLQNIRKGSHDGNALARALASVETDASKPISRGEFATLINSPKPQADASKPILRREALEWMWNSLKVNDNSTAQAK